MSNNYDEKYMKIKFNSDNKKVLEPDNTLIKVTNTAHKCPYMYVCITICLYN